MTDKKLGNVRHLPVAWSEKAELTKKIAQAEKRLLAYQEEAAKYQAEAAEINRSWLPSDMAETSLCKIQPHPRARTG